MGWLASVRPFRRGGARAGRTAAVLTVCAVWLGVVMAGPGEIHAASAADTRQVTPAQSAGRVALPANKAKYACTSATPYGSVLVKPSQWAKGLVNTGHDGANFNVYSNYASGSCDRPIASTDGSDAWGAPPQSAEYQCAELAIRVADAEWATGTQQAWINVGHWDGSAADMQAPGQLLGLTWTANGSGTLPAPGDLMIWSSSGSGDPGHVAVVSAVTSTSVTFVGENQGYGMVTVPVSGTTVEDNGFRGTAITGWLSHQWATSVLGATSTSPPLPPNAEAGGSAYLSSVACPSKTSCVAVGHYQDSSGNWQGLIEALSGGSWKPTEVTLPGNGFGFELTSVACPSTTSCVAVGYDNYSTTPLLVTGSGTHWTATEAPLPANAGSGYLAYLTSVACPSTTSCVAVGGYNGTNPDGPSDELILTGPANSGSLWAATAPPLPLNGIDFDYLNGDDYPAVACMSAASCVTAWTYDDDSGAQQGILESGSGTNWTPSEVPLPANASTSNPAVFVGSAISETRPLACSTATCVMVGQYTDSSSNIDGLLVTGSGTNWTQSEAPLPANAAANGFGGLNSVACESATTCVAVGQYATSGYEEGFMLTGSGTSWTPAAAPVPANAAADAEVSLNSVTCPSTSWCVTAGSYALPFGAVDNYQGLAVIGAGTAWNTTQAPLPDDAYSQGTSLNSVACPSKTSCVAVGGYSDGPTYGLIATGAP